MQQHRRTVHFELSVTFQKTDPRCNVTVRSINFGRLFTNHGGYRRSCEQIIALAPSISIASSTQSRQRKRGHHQPRILHQSLVPRTAIIKLTDKHTKRRLLLYPHPRIRRLARRHCALEAVSATPPAGCVYHDVQRRSVSSFSCTVSASPTLMNATPRYSG